MVELVERDPHKNRNRVVTMSLAGFCLGYYVSIMNSMGKPLLVGRYKLDEEERISVLGNLNFLYPVGAMIGILFSGNLMMTFGRRRLNLLLDIANFISIGLMLIENLYILQLTRVLIGMTSALSCIITGITLVEVFPKNLAGLGNTLIYTFLTLFILITFIQQALVTQETLVTYWRFFLCYPIVLCVLRFYLQIKFIDFDPPSDVFQVHSNSPDLKKHLKESLAALYMDEGLDEKVEEIMEKRKLAGESKEPTLKDMLKPEYRTSMISALVLNVGQQLSGINFLVFFSTELFDNISGNGKTISFAFGVGNFLGSFVCMYFVTRYSRIFTMKLGTLIQGSCLLMTFVCIKIQLYSILPLFIIIYIIFYAVGLGATLGLYVNELLPPSGVGFCMAFNWMIASLVGKLSPWGVGKFGSNVMIIFFCSCCFILYVMIGRLCSDGEVVKTRSLGKTGNQRQRDIELPLIEKS